MQPITFTSTLSLETCFPTFHFTRSILGVIFLPNICNMFKFAILLINVSSHSSSSSSESNFSDIYYLDRGKQL